MIFLVAKAKSYVSKLILLFVHANSIVPPCKLGHASMQMSGTDQNKPAAQAARQTHPDATTPLGKSPLHQNHCNF